MKLTNWLRKAPRPAAILADDQRIEVPPNARAWRDLIATIESLEPAKLTAVDKQGNVIRSITLEDDAPQPSAASPEMSDLQLFAKLLADGYDRGMRANQPVIDSAMVFVERQGQRLAKAESEIDRLRAVIHKQHLQIAELSGAAADGGGDDSLLGSLMAGLAANPLAAVPTIKQPPPSTAVKK